MGRRRTLGYVQNEWTCPNCSTRNKGGMKTCENCGAPQPENVQFELPSEQKFVTDEESIKAAQAAPDIHCAFCGTRNPATAETCSQCGGDLKEGKARQAGRVMQAPLTPAGPKIIKCDNCGVENPGSNSVCSNCGSPLPHVAQAQAAVQYSAGERRHASGCSANSGEEKAKLVIDRRHSCVPWQSVVLRLRHFFCFPQNLLRRLWWMCTGRPLCLCRRYGPSVIPMKLAARLQMLIMFRAMTRAAMSVNKGQLTGAMAIRKWWRNVIPRRSNIVPTL